MKPIKKKSQYDALHGQPKSEVKNQDMHNIVKLLALALANLVSKWPNLAKANLATDLTKPSLDLDKICLTL